MIIADTSIWVDHLRGSNAILIELLSVNQVSLHSWVIGELACGSMANRKTVLGWLLDMPRVLIANEDEVLYFVERHKLMGKGIGYVDAQLLTSASMNSAQLWTKDRRLMEAAQSLGLSYRAAGKLN